MFVEQHDGVACLYLTHDEFALCRLLLVLGETLGVLEFRDGDEFEGHVVADARDIVVDACLEVLVGGLTHEYQ